MNRKYVITYEIIVVLFVIIGTIIMLANKVDNTGLTASGIYNLKYFTVLSNEFCGIIALTDIILFFVKKKGVSDILSFMAASSVGLTFAIIAFFLQPMYRELNLYQGSNLWFHLIVPVTAMIGFVVCNGLCKRNYRIGFKYTFIAAIPSLVYGFAYLINILINGKGEWPDTNDWYGFLNWGYPVGIIIFAVVVIINWLVACFLRALYNRIRVPKALKKKPELTTLCYIEKDGKYLMLHRVKKKHDINKDKYIGVGGHFEYGESPDDCLLREVKEETGLTLTDYRQRGIVTFIYGDEADPENRIVEYMHLYTATGFQGELKECNEGELVWIDKDKVYDLPIWEGDKKFFRLLEEEEDFFTLKLVYSEEGELIS